MASDSGTEKLDDMESIRQDDVSKEEKQVEKNKAVKDTRKRKTDENQNIECDIEVKPKKKKRRLANEKDSDHENECDADNEPNQKSKESNDNTSKINSAPEESQAAPTAAARNSFLPTVPEVCAEFDLNDVKIQYRDVDYQNLTNYKYFTKHVRPILAKDNPKASMVNLMMLVAAKWREFSSQKPFIELAPPPRPSLPPVNVKKKAMPTVEEVCTAFGLKDVEIPNNEVEDVDLTKYRSFAQYVRSILSKENQNAPFAKITMLVAAKWREFSGQKPVLAVQTAPPLSPKSNADSKKQETPTVLEVCTSFGLRNVEIQYRKIDYENLTNYKSFSRYVRPILSKENPKVPASKMMMLVAAKWREFSSQKLAFTEPTSPSPPPSPVADPEKKEMPTIEEVCVAFGLKDVKIDYDELDDGILTNYRSFTRHIRPILSKENPKMSASKILMLVAAKWREVCSQNQLDEETESDENKENEVQNNESKRTRSHPMKRKTPVSDDVSGADEEKTVTRVTRARGGRNQKNVSAGPKVEN